ncbi:hypothetical protein N0V84_005293 [Fusarium piperis]|uniref:Uncharacterized protein n=1 Tax=Fusarium piperis TaxID=1435070 RepID=A0A9W9BQQ4_9HYPO|nr:hypothetical protein N0V84_005293 [Fusarium piperis]
MPHYITRDEYARDQDTQKEGYNAQFQSTHRAIEKVAGEVQVLRADVQVLQADVQVLRADVQVLQTKVQVLQTEVQELRTEFREFKTETERRFNVIDARLKNFNDRFDMMQEDFAELRSQNDHITSRFEEFRTESIQNTAMSRNSRLRNPILPIYQLPVLGPAKGIVYPDAKLFPKNADEFYRLRNPVTERQQRMLVYLASFYDIPYTHPSDTESQSAKDDDDDDDVVIKHPELTLELIEGILGLNEDNFIQFRERARLWVDEPNAPPIKRSNWTNQAHPFHDGAPASQRPRLELRPRSKDESMSKPDSSGSFEWGKDDVVGWRNHSTPSSQRYSMTGLRHVWREHTKMLENAKRSPDTEEKGSSTNPNTPRENAD